MNSLDLSETLFRIKISNMKITIAVPVYGVEKYIERCAISLFEQTYQDIEYIFVDDCTTDDSIRILKNVLEHYPARKSQTVIIRHNRNMGLATARNTAVAAATGAFVLHVDGDDYVDRRIVETMVYEQKQSNADIVLADYVKAYPRFTQAIHHKMLSSPKDFCLAVIARNYPISIWGKLIRTSLYVNYKVKCQDGYNQGEDYQIIPLLYFYAKDIAIISKPLYYYECLNYGSYTNSFTETKLKQNWYSMDCVRDFFQEKGTVYVKAIKEGRLIQVIDDLIISAKADDETAKIYYAHSRMLLRQENLWHVKCVPLFKRPILWLSKVFFVMKAYILISRKIRRFILEIKLKWHKVRIA